MTAAEWATSILSVVAIAVSGYVAWRQYQANERLLALEQSRFEHEQRTALEASTVQRRLLEIEEARHSWEQQRREAESERSDLEAQRRESAHFTVNFAFRDSAQTWGRLVARNDGPAAARDVHLQVWGQRDGQWIEVLQVAGASSQQADLLQPGEGVHVAITFSLGSAQPHDLRYRLTWTDGLGDHTDERQVPVP